MFWSHFVTQLKIFILYSLFCKEEAILKICIKTFCIKKSTLVFWINMWTTGLLVNGENVNYLLLILKELLVKIMIGSWSKLYGSYFDRFLRRKMHLLILKMFLINVFMIKGLFDIYFEKLRLIVINIHVLLRFFGVLQNDS